MQPGIGLSFRGMTTRGIPGSNLNHKPHEMYLHGATDVNKICARNADGCA
jgi:hypothetical protein